LIWAFWKTQNSSLSSFSMHWMLEWGQRMSWTTFLRQLRMWSSPHESEQLGLMLAATLLQFTRSYLRRSLD